MDAGFFVDDPDDLKHIKFLEERCQSLHYAFVSPRRQKMAALSAFLKHTSLTEAAYPSSTLRAQIKKVIDQRKIDVIFLFSAASFTFLPQKLHGIPVVTDFVDVDSAKWEAYSQKAGWPKSAVFAREARMLAAFEAYVARRSATSILVSDDEAALMKNRLQGANETGIQIVGIANGVDAHVFNPDKYPKTQRKHCLIFTGAMDYQPNVEAVVWFAEKVFAPLQEKIPDLRFLIVGRPISPTVAKLAAVAGIEVLGAVDDMAAEIAKANIVVAPLQTARGIQNKVLEGMAMAKPVIATQAANEGINAPDQQAILVADDASEYVQTITNLLLHGKNSKIGSQAREFVLEHFSWASAGAKLDDVLNSVLRGHADKGPPT